MLQEGVERGTTRRKEGQDFQQGQTAGVNHIVQIFTALREIEFCRSDSDNEIASRIGGTFMMIYCIIVTSLIQHKKTYRSVFNVNNSQYKKYYRTSLEARKRRQSSSFSLLQHSAKKSSNDFFGRDRTSRVYLSE